VLEGAEMKNEADVPEHFLNRLQNCPDVEKPYLLAQYANVVRNKRDLNLAC
jgi:hypothetical protein